MVLVSYTNILINAFLKSGGNMEESVSSAAGACRVEEFNTNVILLSWLFKNESRRQVISETKVLGEQPLKDTDAFTGVTIRMQYCRNTVCKVQGMLSAGAGETHRVNQDICCTENYSL